ncbi:serine hydrolase domain-containing protein [Streptomyces avicenniae]|uniref:serine hydrolase domain-containing protein n=1 Tax=Streptomyces avicenniae TaxID=500153 RepID=UPI00069BE36F|nr:serine hydrolase domain-containing protein [Streptomyces avicenniae]
MTRPALPASRATDLLRAATDPLVADHTAPGVVGAAVLGTEAAVVATGHRTAGSAEPVRTDTPFALGSLTKTLTGLLLAELACRGDVSYDDPIDLHLPPAAAPRHATAPITLLDLATHSAGLPRLPGNFYRRGLPHLLSNPYARYREEDLHRATAHVRPRSRVVRYSTFGMGLLGHLLANAAGTDYGTLLTYRLLRPLGMTGTSVSGADGPPPDAATGHRRGRPAHHWTFDALAGAGAAYATGDDMLRYLQAQLRPQHTALSAALTATHQPYHPYPRSPNATCLAWTHRAMDDHTLLWHSGGTGGFTAFIGFSPEARAGAALLANTTPTRGQPVLRAGRRLLDAVVEAATER